ncbi:MAG: EAL domain-containing protein [Alphaproteobacteria bacterium]
MGVETPDLKRQPMMIAGTEAAIGRVHMFIRAIGSALSSAPMVDVTSPELFLAAARDTAAQVSAVILHLPEVQAVWLNALKTLRDEQVTLPLVVLTDDRGVMSSCRELGYKHFLPYVELNSQMLADMLPLVADYAQLQRQNVQLAMQHHTAEQRFRDVADQFADWLWEVDADLKIVFSSSRKRPAQGAERGGEFTVCFLPEEKNRIEDDFAELSRNPKAFHDMDYWSYDAYGTRMCWAVSGVPVVNAQGKVTGFRGLARDVSREKSSVDQLYHLANRDQATGVFNRSRVFEELSRLCRLAKREDRSGVLLVLDIDHFAYINESHGHEVGDKLLVHLTQTLQDNLRTGDILGRTAGNEFAMVLPDVPKQDVDFRVERLVQAIQARPMQLEKGTVSYNVSMGVVRFPLHGKTADELLTKAIRAVTRAKEKGRNRVEVHQDGQGLDNVKAQNLEWVDFLSKCLTDEKQRMVLHYQPIVPLNDEGHKQFYEVLVRMMDTEGNLVTPAKFIHAAEDFGLVPKIDMLVAMRAIEKLQEWHEQKRLVTLSVNISAKTFDNDQFVEQVALKLQNSGLPVGALVLEITETALLRDLAQVRRFIARMKEAGAAFALDDCGVGYSSFNYIRHLALDYIKIDGSFVRNLHMGDDDDAFVKALHDVAKQKSMMTVAEMVEHVGTANKLQKMGVDYGQGYYFASPAADLLDELDLKKLH